MTSLEELRTQLSDVDDQITDLYEKRMKICEDLGTCKIKNGYKTFDRQREKNKIAEVMGKVSSDFNKKGIGNDGCVDGKCVEALCAVVASGKSRTGLDGSGVSLGAAHLHGNGGGALRGRTAFCARRCGNPDSHQ